MSPHAPAEARPGTAINGKRSRASRPKVKTGCKTCKIRHVKCDEQKPACGNCRTTGRTCDGYSVSAAVAVVPSRPPPMPPVVGVELMGTENERRAFHFFRSEVMVELTRAVRTPWPQALLQASHLDPVLRQATMALGALGERFRFNGVLTSHHLQASRRHAQARLHYDRALRELREQLAEPDGLSIESVLMSCFLFICFEFLQGNDLGLLTHLRNGLAIIEGTGLVAVQGERVSLERLPQLSGREQLRLCLLHIFSILDVQAAVWLGLRSFTLDRTLVPLHPSDDDRAEPSDFDSLDDANFSLHLQLNRIYRFRRDVSAKDRVELLGHESVIPETVWGRRRQLIARLGRWPRALGQLQAKLDRDHGLSVEDEHCLDLMRAHHRVATVILALTLQTSEAEARLCLDFEPYFTEILRLAESLLRPVNVMLSQPMLAFLKMPSDEAALPFFHFLAGIIHPLYYTAIKSRQAATQRRAIDLLESSPWREGAWDSAAMAAIARRRLAGSYSTESQCSFGS